MKHRLLTFETPNKFVRELGFPVTYYEVDSLPDSRQAKQREDHIIQQTSQKRLQVHKKVRRAHRLRGTSGQNASYL